MSAQRLDMRNVEVTAAMPNTRLAFADALRLTAILFVVATHFARFTQVQIGGHTRSFDYLGRWAVSMFFVLTGYLLTRPYARAVIDGAKFPSTIEFFSRRFYRLYPLYFICLIASLLLDGAVDHWSVITHLVMIHGFFPRYIGDINGPLWTMWVDAQFYIALPFIALLGVRLLRSQPNRSKRLRGVWIFLAGIVALSIVERYLAMRLIAPSHRDWETLTVATSNLIGMGSQFAIGIAIALIEMESVYIGRARTAAFLSLVMFGMLVGAEKLNDSATGYVLANTVNDFFGGLSAGLLLYACIATRSSRLLAIVRGRVIVTLGSLAYAIYLFHFPIIKYATTFVHQSLASPFKAAIFCVATLVPILLVAFIGYNAIEKPFLRVRDQHREPATAMPQ
jgi:peptidoglycan/LPS O-acetylase OafA/YrhL